MLTVAAPSSGTEAERRALRLFTQWDTGIGVLGGVAAFRPYEDPASGRRQSDIVLLVPDGVVVVRLVASQRQTGPVVAHPSAAWSIGGEALRMAGGGSNPLPSLRAAQAAVASTLRASGLEPGQVAMLAAVGAGEPVEPTDGRLDTGVIVCPISDEGLAVGIRRASALAAAGDVRQWTTADVKAALTALGSAGRVPAVEELNSEGFMYSPYVLRRPDLVAAATAVAAASATESRPDAETPLTQQWSPARDAVEGGRPTGAGRGDPVPGDESADREHADERADDGLAGIFGDRPVPGPAQQPAAEPTARPRDVRGIEPRAGARRGDGPVSLVGGRSRRRGLLLVALLAALLLVAVAVYVGAGLLGSAKSGGSSAEEAVGESVEPSPAEEEPVLQQIGEHAYELAVSRADETCAGNAYGQVADYFVDTDCDSLDRALYTTAIDGVPVIVSVARVTMPDRASAEELKSIADTNGTGNVDDLLRAGERIPDGPTELEAAAYASDLDGDVLTIVVAGWLDPGAPGDEQALDQLAVEALSLEPPA